MDFSVNPASLTEDLKVLKFLESWKPSCQDWRLRQASTAIDLYRTHFHKQPSNHNPISPEKNACLGLPREILRLRRYAYKTEKSYLLWVRSFSGYMTGIQPEKNPEQWSHEDVIVCMSPIQKNG